MLNKKEIISAFIAIILMTFALSYLNFSKILLYLIFSLIIILVSVFSKKITSRVIDVQTEIKSWSWKRYGLYSRAEFKKAIPIGFLLSPLLTLLLGFRYFFCFLEFEAKALPSKVVKKFGSRRFSGIMEWDDALIVFYSAIPLMLLAIIVRFIDLVQILELSKLCIYYLAWNLIPIGQLDGTRLLFGSKPLFVFTWVLLVLTYLVVIL